ncbi:MAG: hypothetical protein FWC43_05580 [Planctomycetaceae bacterium]|nr:hypothetical protein [Planctomycetaceae bacterium]
MDEKTEKKIHWRTVVVAVLISLIITPPGRFSSLESKFNGVNHKLLESKETIDKQQRQIDDLKRELEEMKQK